MHAATGEIGVCLALTQALGRARALGEVYAAALDAVRQGLGVQRAAVLLADPDGALRVEASRGLSESFRRSIEGYAPWPADAVDPDPVVLGDARLAPALAPYRHALAAECLHAAAFVPLVGRDAVVGAFMLYADQPRAIDDGQLQLARLIAAHVVVAVERLRAEEAAQEAARAQDEFLATLSHELRTPLSAILGWVQLLQSGRLAEDRIAEGVATIGRNARLQAQLIDDILDHTRIVTGTLALRSSTVEVADLVDQALSAVRPIAAAKGVVLRQQVPSDVPPVHGDPRRLQQVLGHLLANAVKGTPPGGRVTLACAVDGREVVLEVRDTGEGIPPALVPMVFERLVPGDSRAARQHGGLGLAIARHLVERHGGTISASSDGAGQGAVFTVRLPAGVPDAALDDALAPVEDACAGPLLPGVRALVVDDDRDARHLVATLLGQHGADVLQAPDADAAWQALAAAPVDVLIADLAMPGTDGFALMRSVRLAHPGTPALALTACARPEDRTRARLAGFDGFCTKPFEAEGLVRALRGLLGLATASA